MKIIVFPFIVLLVVCLRWHVSADSVEYLEVFNQKYSDYETRDNYPFVFPGETSMVLLDRSAYGELELKWSGSNGHNACLIYHTNAIKKDSVSKMAKDTRRSIGFHLVFKDATWTIKSYSLNPLYSGDGLKKSWVKFNGCTDEK